MSIHIVCPDDGHVIPRLMQALAERNGYSLGECPCADADLNYFAPYLAYDDTPTRTAAWFTHYEARTVKGDVWRRRSCAVDLRIVTAQHYGKALAAHGLTIKVTPGVDLDHLRPARRQVSRPVVGIVGLGSWRKGAALVQRLARDCEAHRPGTGSRTASRRLGRGASIELRVAGTGWGVSQARRVAWRNMPAFYRGLNALVCTALIEGIPMPPLEALACGVKVVIPNRVGMLDELPTMPGIYRYRIGNYDHMRAALAVALNERVNRADLRAVVQRYSLAAWAQSHARAFEAVL